MQRYVSGSLANRGMNFEALVEIQNKRYRAHGLAVIDKQNTKFLPIRKFNPATGKSAVVSAKVDAKATVDFMGRYMANPIAFECKHTADERIAFDRVGEHQVSYLRDWVSGEEAIGFIFVSFGMRDFYVIPFDEWERLKRESGKKSVNKKNLPAIWRVKPKDGEALDYLATVRDLWYDFIHSGDD